MAGLPKAADPNLLVGYDSSDDAAVYKVSHDVAMIQTVDFFPPVVDDPYTFGQIAATNALSDVYAMGGEPRLAMNLLAFPSCLPVEAVGDILAGGASKVTEAGAIIAGGHSIEDQEPKYGLCVTGLVHPRRILTNSGAKVGDILVLTKALGTGVLSTAAKAELLEEADYKHMVELMTTLNKYAAQAVGSISLSACTDVTGFGLVGHVKEMAEGSGTTMELWAGKVPIVPKALELARDGIIPAGAYRNMDFTAGDTLEDSAVPREVLDCLYDPQTAGGLLFSVPERQLHALMGRMMDAGVPAVAVGAVRPRGEKLVHIKP